jgi:hypothetical protein
MHPLLRSALEQANEWPAFIRPIPDRILSEDRQYLARKQVFTLPPLRLQNALLAAYVEYVHPYMPLMELHDFLRVVGDRSGASGKISLFLYHAVMFSATAFVDESLLRDAGYDSRREARRAFFSRTRVSSFLGDGNSRKLYVCACSDKKVSSYTTSTTRRTGSSSSRACS